MRCLRPNSPPSPDNTPTRATAQPRNNQAKQEERKQLYKECSRLVSQMQDLDKRLRTPATDQLRRRAIDLQLQLCDRRTAPLIESWHELNEIKKDAEDIVNPTYERGESSGAARTSGSESYNAFDYSGSFSLGHQARPGPR
ncbi:hypothetical protein BIY29_05295 [Brenneria alni]|uniref:Uncharacterized protein n=1 Tax=Brenneria alni TaxID=71656 RepID=A0A421DR10_9GAMM|nr:hypothetical protein BIY29_05295 [Brenneria alni]